MRIILGARRILVVAAHPDDEVLGMGGTLFRLAEHGVKIHLLFLSLGEASRGEAFQDENLRMKQAKMVASKIGAECYLGQNFPDNSFDSVPLLDITKVIESYILKIQPDTIFTHHRSDLNIDHRIAFQAVLTATRPGKSSVGQIFSFEVLSSTEWQAKTATNIFLPNTYLNIEKYLQKKVNLLQIYEREMAEFPHPRSTVGIKTLARFRGLESGLLAAEAFELVRSISF